MTSGFLRKRLEIWDPKEPTPGLLISLERAWRPFNKTEGCKFAWQDVSPAIFFQGVLIANRDVVFSRAIAPDQGCAVLGLAAVDSMKNEPVSRGIVLVFSKIGS